MKTYVITSNKGKLNLREQPEKNSKVLAQIPYGTELEVESTTGEWSKVIYNSYTGYVMNKYLGDNSISKEKLQKIYNSLKETLKLIEEVLK